jgi:alpha-N-acetylglucosaminidase
MIHTIIKYLLISTTLFFCSCHKPKTDIITPAKQLIERQIGERAQSIHFEYIEPSDGKDIFEVIASDGRLTLRGSSSVAICYAFHTYMKEACKSMKTWSGEHITSVMPWPDYELYEQVSQIATELLHLRVSRPSLAITSNISLPSDGSIYSKWIDCALSPI